MSVLIKDKTTGEWVQAAGGSTTLYAEAPIGSITPFGGTTAPDGFLLCQGQAVSRTTYAELFAVIGTSFGSGDGSTTFNIPDLRETVPVGSGTRESGVTVHDAYGVGQFKDDQLQNHYHSTKILYSRAEPTYVEGSSLHILGGTPGGSTAAVSEVNSARAGTTTHGKQLGVNYIIKATQVGVPADFVPVDIVENGNMKAVTSNAVYDAMNVVQSGTGVRNTSYVSSDGFYCTWYKVGRICTVNIQYNLSQLTPSSVEVITGLPKPVTEIAGVGEGGSNTDVSGFVIKTNGTVRTHYDGVSGQFMHGTATYITAE